MVFCFTILFLYCSVALAYDAEKDLQSVYSQQDYTHFFDNRLKFAYPINVGILGFEKVFTERNLHSLLEKYVSTVQPKIRNGIHYQDSRVIYGFDYKIIRIPERYLSRYIDVMKSIMTSQFEKNENTFITPKTFSNYLINFDNPQLKDIMNQIYDYCGYGDCC